jgi:hypothetical protein
MDTKNALAEYIRQVFDLNKDGRVTFKEFVSTFIPSSAVAIALVVVDVLAIVGEIRVWDVGMKITGGNVLTSLGFVAVSLVPFYLAQILWLYPLASGWQQFIAVVMAVLALLTSVQFGIADLSQQYDVVAISNLVVRLWLAYIIMLLLYVVIDANFRLHREKIKAQAKAQHQSNVNAVTAKILKDLELTLQKQRELEERYGEEAVRAHIDMLTQTRSNNHRQPNPQ